MTSSSDVLLSRGESRVYRTASTGCPAPYSDRRISFVLQGILLGGQWATALIALGIIAVTLAPLLLHPVRLPRGKALVQAAWVRMTTGGRGIGP